MLQQFSEYSESSVHENENENENRAESQKEYSEEQSLDQGAQPGNVKAISDQERIQIFQQSINVPRFKKSSSSKARKRAQNPNIYEDQSSSLSEADD